MHTDVLPCDEAGMERAAALLRQGQVVAFPTETVYGLGANALSDVAVRRIFQAKDRPADNPLIVHIVCERQAFAYARDVTQEALLLMEAFWPGPLTLVLPMKEGALPGAVTAGLSTFAVRLPAHPVAKALIERTGAPIAAPSANRSGRPSPTTAEHVLEDMLGCIPLILDGGACEVGLESTVVSATPEGVELLRPGGITLEMLSKALAGRPIGVAPGVDEPVAQGAVVRSPGMKHRHYAPKARMVVVDDRARALAKYEEELARGGKPVLLLCGAPPNEGQLWIDLSDRPEQTLFSALRRADAMGATLVVFLSVPCEGVGRAVMNRALRAAGFWRE